MKRTSYISYFTLSAIASAAVALAQDQPAPQPQDPPSVQQQQQADQNRGWRRVDTPAPQVYTDGAPVAGAPDQAPPPSPPPGQNGRVYAQQDSGQPAPPPNYDAYPAAPPRPTQQGPRPMYQPSMRQGGQQPPPQARGPIPATLTIRPGTYVTVRVNQVLSSDRNHAGDAFSATLVKPVVVDGVVVADRGQTIGGRVAEAKKAGMVQGVSKLGVQLTDLTLLDGQNLPIQSQLISHDGRTSVGRDVGAVGTTTAVGAAAGAAADWGRGAAIGAGAGAAVGIIGVLLTRGEPTIIHPEQVLTFRLESPVTVSTEHAPQAFRWVAPGDYDQPQDLQRRPPQMRVAGPYGYPAPYPYYASPYYPFYGYGWGPSFGVYVRGGYRR